MKNSSPRERQSSASLSSRAFIPPCTRCRGRCFHSSASTDLAASLGPDAPPQRRQAGTLETVWLLKLDE